MKARCLHESSMREDALLFYSDENDCTFESACNWYSSPTNPFLGLFTAPSGDSVGTGPEKIGPDGDYDATAAVSKLIISYSTCRPLIVQPCCCVFVFLALNVVLFYSGRVSVALMVYL